MVTFFINEIRGSALDADNVTVSFSAEICLFHLLLLLLFCLFSLTLGSKTQHLEISIHPQLVHVGKEVGGRL